MPSTNASSAAWLKASSQSLLGARPLPTLPGMDTIFHEVVVDFEAKVDYLIQKKVLTANQVILAILGTNQRYKGNWAGGKELKAQIIEPKLRYLYPFLRQDLHAIKTKNIADLFLAYAPLENNGISRMALDLMQEAGGGQDEYTYVLQQGYGSTVLGMQSWRGRQEQALSASQAGLGLEVLDKVVTGPENLKHEDFVAALLLITVKLPQDQHHVLQSILKRLGAGADPSGLLDSQVLQQFRNRGLVSQTTMTLMQSLWEAASLKTNIQDRVPVPSKGFRL